MEFVTCQPLLLGINNAGPLLVVFLDLMFFSMVIVVVSVVVYAGCGIIKGIRRIIGKP